MHGLGVYSDLTLVVLTLTMGREGWGMWSRVMGQGMYWSCEGVEGGGLPTFEMEGSNRFGKNLLRILRITI